MKLRPISVVSVCVAIITIAVHAMLAPALKAEAAVAYAASTSSRTPAKFCRAPDNTFLTYPEWFLVWSPRELAQFIDHEPPSQFPYLRHVGQFWQAYSVVYDSTKNERPFNWDYHSMIWVIGASITGEYTATRAYESLLGRSTEAARFHGMTAEDKLAARVASDYAAYLDAEPFYKFDYMTPLKQTWTETGFWGPDPLRKWERKYFLTTQYAFKTGYCWLMKKSSESAYGIEATTTVVVLDHAPDSTVQTPLKILDRFPDGGVLVELPRYQAFTPAATELAKSGFHFLEIAGNSGPILITAIIPTDFKSDTIHPLFSQPIITRPGYRRIAFTSPVRSLSTAILELQQPQIVVEHIYDY